MTSVHSLIHGALGRWLAEPSSVIHVLAVILCQNIFIRVIWSGREMCPLLMNPYTVLVF